MTPQTKARRTAMIEQIITDTALDYRFDDKGQPRTTDAIKPALDDYIERWGRQADKIDKWAAQWPKFADGFIGLRPEMSGALSCQFNLTKGAVRAGAKLRTAHWRALGVLDDLAEHAARGATKLTVPVEIIQWMADGIFLSLIPPTLLDRAAHGKGHLWDRRLRHTKRSKARRAQAFNAETALTIEDTQIEAEFELLLRDTIRKDGKLRRDVQSDPKSKEVNFSIAPPLVKITRLADHKSFMLVPYPSRAKRPQGSKPDA